MQVVVVVVVRHESWRIDPESGYLLGKKHVKVRVLEINSRVDGSAATKMVAGTDSRW